MNDSNRKIYMNVLDRDRAAMIPIAIIALKFCLPNPVHLTVTNKLSTMWRGDFAVFDEDNGNGLFNVRGKFLSLGEQRILNDAAGKPLVTMKEKVLSSHDKWHVYRGKNLLFSVKRSSLRQSRTELDVFLAANTKKDAAWDFKIKRNKWFWESYTIYSKGINNNAIPIAQMRKRHDLQSVLLGKENFQVTVYPNVDYAFISTLVVLLSEINQQREREEERRRQREKDSIRIRWD